MGRSVMKKIICNIIFTFCCFACIAQNGGTWIIPASAGSGGASEVHTFDIDTTRSNDTMFFYHNFYVDGVLTSVDTTFDTRRADIVSILCYESFDTIPFDLNLLNPSAGTRVNNPVGTPTFRFDNPTIIESITLDVYGSPSTVSLNIIEGANLNTTPTVYASDGTQSLIVPFSKTQMTWNYTTTEAFIPANEYHHLAFFAPTSAIDYYFHTDINPNVGFYTSGGGLQSEDAGIRIQGKEILAGDQYTLVAYANGDTTIINQVTGAMVEMVNPDWVVCGSDVQDIQYNYSDTLLTDSSTLIILCRDAARTDCDTVEVFDSQINYIDDVASLRSTNGREGMDVVLESYYTNGLKGGGNFHFSSVDVYGSGDDGGNVFSANGNGFWIRNTLSFNVEDFGATAGDATDDTQFIQNCINRSSVLRGSVIIPTGEFLVTPVGNMQTIANVGVHQYCLIIPSNTNIELEGIIKIMDGSQVDGSTPVTPIYLENSSNVVIDGKGIGLVTGNTAGQVGWTGGYAQILNGNIFVALGTCDNVTVKNIRLEDHFSNPIKAEGDLSDFNFINVSSDNMGEGLEILDCVGLYIDNYNHKNTNNTNVGDGSEIGYCEDVTYVNSTIIGNYTNTTGSGLDLFASNNIIVDNFKSLGWKGGLEINKSNTGVNCTNVKVSNSLIETAGFNVHAVAINSDSLNLIEFDNVRAICTTSNVGSAGFLVGENGTQKIKGKLILRNCFAQNYKNGVEIRTIQNALILDGEYSNNTENGIMWNGKINATSASDIESFIVDGTTLNNNSDYGLLIKSSQAGFDPVGFVNVNASENMGESNDFQNLQIRYEVGFDSSQFVMHNYSEGHKDNVTGTSQVEYVTGSSLLRTTESTRFILGGTKDQLIELTPRVASVFVLDLTDNGTGNIDLGGNNINLLIGERVVLRFDPDGIWRLISNSKISTDAFTTVRNGLQSNANEIVFGSPIQTGGIGDLEYNTTLFQDNFDFSIRNSTNNASFYPTAIFKGTSGDIYFGVNGSGVAANVGHLFFDWSQGSISLGRHTNTGIISTLGQNSFQLGQSPTTGNNSMGGGVATVSGERCLGWGNSTVLGSRNVGFGESTIDGTRNFGSGRGDIRSGTTDNASFSNSTITGGSNSFAAILGTSTQNNAFTVRGTSNARETVTFGLNNVNNSYFGTMLGFGAVEFTGQNGFNVVSSDVLFELGNGNGVPSNAITVLKSGWTQIRGNDAASTQADVTPVGALDVTSRSGAFLPPRMTGSDASNLSVIDGSFIYVTSIQAPIFTQIGFWGVENGVWVKK